MLCFSPLSFYQTPLYQISNLSHVMIDFNKTCSQAHVFTCNINFDLNVNFDLFTAVKI